MILFLGLALIPLYIIPTIVIWWKLYRKAGQHGWAALAPVYNQIVMARVGNRPKWLGWLAGFLSLASFDYNTTSGVVKGTLLFLRLPIEVAGFMMAVYSVLWTVLFISMARRFNRGVGFWLTVIFLPVVAVFMMKNVAYKGGTCAKGCECDPDTKCTGNCC